MLFSAQKIIGLPSRSAQKDNLGSVEGFMIESTRGKIYALILAGGRFFPYDNVKQITKKQIEIFTDTEPLEQRSRKKIAQGKQVFPILGHRVITEGGFFLGRLKDFKFDSISGLLIQYYVKRNFFLNLIGGGLVINRKDVVYLTKKQLVVRDDVAKIKISLRVFQAQKEAVAAGAMAAN